MNNPIDTNKDWCHTLRDRVREVDTPPSKNLWGDIEMELDKLDYDQPSTLPQSIHLWRWAGGVAAVAAILIAALCTLIPSTTEVMPYATLQEEFVEVIDKHEDITSTTNDIAIEELSNVAPMVKTSEVTALTDDEENIAPTPEQNPEKEKVEKEKDSSSTNRIENAHYHYANSYPSYTKLKQRKEGRTTLSLSGSGGLQASNTAIHTIQPTAYDVLLFESEEIGTAYNQSHAMHHQPFSIGLRVQHAIYPRFSIASGVSYTKLLSEITYSTELDEQQQIHFIGVPLHLYYQFLSVSNLALYTGVGGTVEYCLSATVGNVKANEKPFHFSTNAVVGAAYSLNNWVGLFFEPEISYHLTETNLKSIRNDSPITYTLRLGISFTL